MTEHTPTADDADTTRRGLERLADYFERHNAPAPAAGIRKILADRATASGEGYSDANLREAIRRAKSAADEKYGIAWSALEEISRVELILAALPASQPEGDAFAFRQARSVAVDEYGYDSVLGALSEIPILQAQVATLTARVETLEGDLSDRIGGQREAVARMCLSAIFGFEFTGESLCDDAERIFSRPSPRSIRAVAFADQLIEHFTRAALSPDPAGNEVQRSQPSGNALAGGIGDQTIAHCDLQSNGGEVG